MKHKWLQKNNNKKLIIFFNGWAMDENAVSHLDCEDYDVIVFYDYGNLDTDAQLGNYDEKYIIAWSMGVLVSGSDNNNIKEIIKNYSGATAIAGTPLIIDDKFGIPEKIYNLTYKGFNEESSEKFFKKMFNNLPKDIFCTNRTFESQKTELEMMSNYKFVSDIKFTRVIIPDKDFIIPGRNQKRYWETEYKSKTDIEIVSSGHYPFMLYNKFSELI